MLADLAAFQFVWFACVLSAAHGWPWLGVAVAATRIRPRKWRLLAAGAAIGLAGEWALHSVGVTGYPPQVWTGGPIPAWMVALWVNFAASLDECLVRLRGRYALATMAGAVGGPAAYWGGERLGAITLNPDPTIWIAGIGLLWAVAAPVLVWLAEEEDARAST